MVFTFSREKQDGTLCACNITQLARGSRVRN
jgi:hypothetical protein